MKMLRNFLLAAALTLSASTAQAQVIPGPAISIFPSSAAGVTSLAGTANQITASAATGAITLSTPSDFRLPGTINLLMLTQPAAAATLTLANNSSLITSGAFATTITSTATTNSTLPAGTHSLAPLDSPSFTMPALGVATGTSVALGGCVIGSDIECISGGFVTSSGSTRQRMTTSQADFQILGAGNSSGAFQLNADAGVNQIGTNINGNITGASGTTIGTRINPTVNQSSTAGADALRINPTVTAKGSGGLNLIHGLAGAAGTTDVFSITDAGLFTTIGGITTSGAIQINASNPLTMGKSTDPGTAPGATFCKEYWIAGTNANTGKKVAYCGTSTTPVTIVDNVGGGL